MKTFQTSETPAIADPQTIAEAMLLNRIAQTYLDDEVLRAKTSRVMKSSIEGSPAPYQTGFTANESGLLLTGMKHVIAFRKGDDYVIAAAQMFLDEREYPEARELNDMRVKDNENRLIAQGVTPYASRLIGQRAIEAHTTFDELAGREMAARQDFPTGQLELPENTVAIAKAA